MYITRQNIMKINSISQNNYNSSSFCAQNAQNSVVEKQPQNTDKQDKKVLLTSIGCSLAAILLALKTISNIKKAKGAKDAKMFNVHLREMDILSLGLATVGGAYVGGVLTDKPEHKKAKTREAMHQMVANIITPMITILAFNKLGEKLNVKVPKIKSKSAFAKGANVVGELLPNLVTSCAGLWAGIQIGNKISNKIAKQVFTDDKEKREVKAIDYCVHIDDPLTIITLADKSGQIKAFTSKTMPFTFILSGIQTGTAKKAYLERENTSTPKSL